MNKKLITKIFIIIFTMGISFVGLDFVSAAGSVDCSKLSSSSPDSCNASPINCRLNPSDGDVQCPNAECERDKTSITRYNNDCNTYNPCFEGTESSDFTTFISVFGGGIGSPDAVRSLQEKINITAFTFSLDGCKAICEDGRFGNNTIKALKVCLPCKNDPNRRSTRNATTKKFECPNGSDPSSDGCCPALECTTKITTDATYRVEGDDINVTVQFLSTAVFDKFVGDFKVDGGSISEEDCNVESASCVFVVTPNEGENVITITSPKGRALYSGNIECESSEELITLDIPEEEQKCEDPQKPLSGADTCEQSYGTGWTEYNQCCYPPCGGDTVSNGQGGCKCNKIGQPAPEGKRLDEQNCKRVCDSSKQCCGIELNTVVPFIGDCIEMTTQNDTASSNGANTSSVNQLNAFPFLMMGLSKILVTVILVFSFLIVIVAGLMMVTGVANESNYKKGMERIKKVIVALILLGSSGLILKLINPNFFGG